MPRKTFIAVLVSLVAAFSAVPAVAKSGKGQRHKCTNGVTNKQYCENENAAKGKENAKDKGANESHKGHGKGKTTKGKGKGHGKTGGNSGKGKGKGGSTGAKGKGKGKSKGHKKKG
jgi:hypothetical protein